jgi:hypothetical protein
MPRDLNHPVWDVYDLLRTARLNVKYYSCRVALLQRQNFWIEGVLAATASGSAIAGLAFWDTTYGAFVWRFLVVVSAILAVVKPLLKLAERMQNLEELVGEYRAVEYELKKIEVAVKQRHAYEKELQDRFASAMDRMGEIANRKGHEFRVDEKLRGRCEKEVATELPAHHFFVPT